MGEAVGSWSGLPGSVCRWWVPPPPGSAAVPTQFSFLPGTRHWLHVFLLSSASACYSVNTTHAVPVCSLLYPGTLAVKDWHVVGMQPKRLNEWELKVLWEHQRGSSALAWVEQGHAEMALLMLGLEGWVRVCQLPTRLQRSISARGAEV